MKAKERDIRRLCDELGLKIVKFQQVSGSSHLKIDVVTPGGNTFMSVFALSQSEPRAIRNKRAELRRKVRELDGQ